MRKSYKRTISWMIQLGANAALSDVLILVITEYMDRPTLWFDMIQEKADR